MPHVVDFKSVSTVGVESSPVAEALAGLRPNEARYFHNKYDIDFTTEPAEGTDTLAWVTRILEEERGIVVSSRALDGMEVPDELGAFKFARQKSKLAGTIRGSYFAVKGEY